MKICHLIYDDLNNPWLAGGGALRAWEIYTRLAERHEITLITGNFPGAQAEEWVEGVRLLRVGPALEDRSERNYVRSRLGYCRRAVACLQQVNWDLWVHEFSAFAPLWVPGRLRRRGLLLFLHAVGRHALKKHPLVGGFAWAAEELTLRAYRRIVTISPSMQDYVTHVRRRQVQVDCVYTGVDGRYFGLEPTEDEYILYFGRTDVHTKGLDMLIQAFGRIAGDFPSLRLKIAGRPGSPRQTRSLEQLVRASGTADRIDVLGWVDESEKCELLRHALFVCAPSRYEGWCIAAIEASAAGKAVLGTQIKGLQDAVRHDETGLLVEPGSPEALAQGMRQLLADPERRQRMGRQGRTWAGRFDWDRIARDQEAVYLQAMEANQQ